MGRPTQVGRELAVAEPSLVQGVAARTFSPSILTCGPSISATNVFRSFVFLVNFCPMIIQRLRAVSSQARPLPGVFHLVRLAIFATSTSFLPLLVISGRLLVAAFGPIVSADAFVPLWLLQLLTTAASGSIRASCSHH